MAIPSARVLGKNAQSLHKKFTEQYPLTPSFTPARRMALAVRAAAIFVEQNGIEEWKTPNWTDFVGVWGSLALIFATKDGDDETEMERDKRWTQHFYDCVAEALEEEPPDGETLGEMAPPNSQKVAKIPQKAQTATPTGRKDTVLTQENAPGSPLPVAQSSPQQPNSPQVVPGQPFKPGQPAQQQSQHVGPTPPTSQGAKSAPTGQNDQTEREAARKEAQRIQELARENETLRKRREMEQQNRQFQQLQSGSHTTTDQSTLFSFIQMMRDDAANERREQQRREEERREESRRMLEDLRREHREEIKRMRDEMTRAGNFNMGRLNQQQTLDLGLHDANPDDLRRLYTAFGGTGGNDLPVNSMIQYVSGLDMNSAPTDDEDPRSCACSLEKKAFKVKRHVANLERRMLYGVGAEVEEHRDVKQFWKNELRELPQTHLRFDDRKRFEMVITQLEVAHKMLVKTKGGNDICMRRLAVKSYDVAVLAWFNLSVQVLCPRARMAALHEFNNRLLAAKHKERTKWPDLADLDVLVRTLVDDYNAGKIKARTPRRDDPPGGRQRGDRREQSRSRRDYSARRQDDDRRQPPKDASSGTSQPPSPRGTKKF